MRIPSLFIQCGFFVACAFLLPQAAQASLALSRLSSTSSSYKGDVETISKAIAFSVMQPESRTKIPGPASIFLETGYHVTEVNDKRLYLYTDNNHSPSAFHSLFATVGVGLPFGLAASLGFSQVISEHRFNALSASLTAQVFDFSNLIYTDLVPTLTLDATLTRTLSDPSCSVYVGQANLGAFQRTWGMQFAYLFQASYTVLGAATTSNSNLFLRHGVMIAVPLWVDITLRSQLLLPDLTATVGLGYEF